MAKEKLEQLEKKRVARRARYKKIKENAEKYAIEKTKKREAYLKRKLEKKVKGIDQMSPREQRAQRKRWRENSKRYLKKKAEERKLQEIIISQGTELGEGEVVEEKFSDPLKATTVEKESNEKKIKILQTKIKSMKKKYATERKEMTLLIRKYQYKCRILTNRINKIYRKYAKRVEKQKEENFVTPDQPITSDNCTKDINKDESIVIKRLTSNTNLRKKCLTSKLQQKMNQGYTSIHKIIEVFYEDDINSRIGAGKKQSVKAHGLTKQKRYLLDSVKNLHRKFLEENPNLRISYVTFSILRPFWVFLPRDDRETCACTIHTNIDLILLALKKKKIIVFSNFQDMLAVICCDKYDTNCVARKCVTCQNKVIPYQEFSDLEEITYYEWSRDKKKVGSSEINIVKKFTRSIKPRDLILKLEDALPKFLGHTLNILNQYQKVTQLKHSLNPNEVLIHMDFSENYSYKFSQEIQSLHFGGSRGQLSLHTVVIYIKEGRETVNYSLCTVSECTRHDSPAVWAHLHRALEFAFEKCPLITTVHVLTDSPTSQYRNKQIFYIMTQLYYTFTSLKTVTWNYLEAGHGKGAPDGIGAVLKRTADYQVKCGRDVGDFPTFVELVRENIKNIEIKIVEEHEILEKAILLPNDIVPFKGTMTVHQVVWSSASEFLEFRKLSCFICINKICDHDNNHMQLFKMFKTTCASAIENVKNFPPGKQIKVLNDVSVQYSQPHTRNISSTSRKKKSTRRPVKKLADVKEKWENVSFSGNNQKVSGHELEFLRFLHDK